MDYEVGALRAHVYKFEKKEEKPNKHEIEKRCTRAGVSPVRMTIKVQRKENNKIQIQSKDNNKISENVKDNNKTQSESVKKSVKPLAEKQSILAQTP